MKQLKKYKHLREADKEFLDLINIKKGKEI